MDLLETVIQPYAWGSRTFIPHLQGRAPSERPEAELWLGAHAAAPSRVVRDGAPRSLIDVIAADREREVGPGQDALPFLLKVLAAETPLSIQAHPSLEQARAGYAREEAAGIPRDAAHRCYRDANHKPELICALTPFSALCGFRTLDETRALFAALDLEPPRDVRGTFEAWLAGSQPVDDVIAACRAHPLVIEAAWATRLADLYPGDVGAACSLLMNLVELAPGEALYLPAGNLHAYLRGAGVEVMASSDNVLRGGLTPKHIDVPELLRVVDFSGGPVPVVRPRAEPGGEEIYDTPAPEFRLSRIALRRDTPFSPARRGPEILLCTGGELAVGGLRLASGQAAFVPAGDPPYEASGEGTLFRATPGARAA